MSILKLPGRGMTATCMSKALAGLTVATLVLIALATRADESAKPGAEPLKSGPQVGEKVATFYVRAITGPLKNKSVCYVCRNGDRPVVMLFIRKITPELKTLLKGIDAEVDGHRAEGLRSFGVFVAGDSQELLPQVQTLSFDEKINLPLTIAAAPSDGSASGTIPADAAVTVVLYRDLTVTDNFAFRADELTSARITTILEAIRRLAETD